MRAFAIRCVLFLVLAPKVAGADNHELTETPCTPQHFAELRGEVEPFVNASEFQSYREALESIFNCSVQAAVTQGAISSSYSVSPMSSALGELEYFAFDFASDVPVAVIELSSWAAAQQESSPSLESIPRYAVTGIEGLTWSDIGFSSVSGSSIAMVGSDDLRNLETLVPIDGIDTTRQFQLIDAIALGLGRDALITVRLSSSPTGAQIQVDNENWGPTNLNMYGTTSQVPTVRMYFEGNECIIVPNESMYSNLSNEFILHCDFSG